MPLTPEQVIWGGLIVFMVIFGPLIARAQSRW